MSTLLNFHGQLRSERHPPLCLEQKLHYLFPQSLAVHYNEDSDILFSFCYKECRLDDVLHCFSLIAKHQSKEFEDGDSYFIEGEFVICSEQRQVLFLYQLEEGHLNQIPLHA